MGGRSRWVTTQLGTEYQDCFRHPFGHREASDRLIRRITSEGTLRVWN